MSMTGFAIGDKVEGLYRGRMKLKSHGRYDYSAITERKDYSWPGGKRLAVHFCLNVEHFSFGEGLGNDYGAPHPQPPVSPELLGAGGFRYMMDWPLDDQPVWFRTKHGPILSVPYAHDLNDSFEAVSRRTPSQLHCENLVDQFDELLEESAERPLVMSVVLHSFILGQPHRLRRFRKVIEHIVEQRERVWLTRPGDICRYIESLPPGVVPGS